MFRDTRISGRMQGQVKGMNDNLMTTSAGKREERDQSKAQRHCKSAQQYSASKLSSEDPCVHFSFI